MGYYQGEGVLDCTYCEEDVLNTAKSNIRQFIEVIIGIVLGLAILALILSSIIGSISCLGGCLGCEACLETAACADEMIEDCDVGCSYVEMTQDNIDRANDCVSCDGIDCFGRQGCFSCEGVGDCDSCSGKMYYNFKVSYNGQETSYSVEENDGFYEFSSNDYYRFLGLYSKAGKQFVNEYGDFVEKPRQGMVLYPRFEEYNVGETYYFYFDLTLAGAPAQRIAFQVGSSMTDIPVAPDKVGYTFAGWCLDNRLVIRSDAMGGEFHLSNFGISPHYGEREYVLTPKYEPIDCQVTFIIYRDGYSETYTVNASYNDTFAQACARLRDHHGVTIQDHESFFGWGESLGAEPEAAVSNNYVIQSALRVYAIIREAVWVNFHYNTENHWQPEQIKFREGETDVRFSRLSQLEGVKEDSFNPGYKFMGWYPTSYEVPNEQPIDGISLVDKNMATDYYARWQKADYKISYNVMNYALGVSNELWLEDYQMQDYALTLKDASQITPQPGYDFIGWRMPSGEVVKSLPANTYGNIELHAAFTPHTYKIYLSSGPQSSIPGAPTNYPSSSEVSGLSYGENYTLPVPTKAGYVFDGWYLDEDSIELACTDKNGRSKNPLTLQSFEMETTIAREEELYIPDDNAYVLNMKAKWSIQTYMVTFLKDGSRYAEQAVEHNGTVDFNKISEPSKDGYNFLGWAYESGILFAANESISSDLTLYAKFEIKKFTVTFMIETVKGGTQQPYTVDRVEWGTELKKAVERISGYPNDEALHRRRVGWYRTENYQSQMRDTDVIREAIIVYAKYEYADQYTFDKAAAQYYYQGETVNFPEAAEQAGYEFLGWCTDVACQTTPVWKNVKISSSTARQYYAKYQPITYKITYQYEDGSTFTTDTYKITDMANGATRPLIGVDGAPKKTGYTFIGWKLGKDIVTELTKRFGDIILVAQYKANEYKVTLLNEGNNAEKPVTFDQPFNFGVPSEKTGYHFIGWSWTNRGNDLATDQSGKSLPGKNYAYAQNSAIYPIYEVNSYTIYWRNAETDKLYVMTQANHFSKLTAGYEADEPGYRFVGWYEDKDCQKEYVFNTYEITGELTLYAKFEPNDYQVIFVIDTGVKCEFILKYGESLADAMAEAMLEVNKYTAKNDYRFVHWEDKDSNRVYESHDTVPALNLTLKPKFYYPVIVEFYEGNECVYTSQKYYYDDSITAYSYEKTGYTFKGWYKNGSLSENMRVDFPVKVDDVMSETTYYYYAKWEANTYTINYYMDGNSHSSESFKMNQTEVYGGFALKTLGTTEKPGYVFDGWYLTSDCSGERITALDNSMGVQNEDLYKSGTITLYGKWVKATYTITLMKDGDTVLKTITVEYGQDLSGMNLPTLENMNNKQFYGWKLQDTGKKVVNEYGIWLSDTYTWTHDIVLVADWW